MREGSSESVGEAGHESEERDRILRECESTQTFASRVREIPDAELDKERDEHGEVFD